MSTTSSLKLTCEEGQWYLRYCPNEPEVEVLSEPGRSQPRKSEDKIPLVSVWPEFLWRPDEEYTVPLSDVVGINFELFQEKVRRRIDGRMTIIRKSRFSGRFWCRWFLLWFLSLLLMAGITAVSGPISALVGMALTIFGVAKHQKVPAWLVRTVVFSCVPLLLLRALWALIIRQVASPEGLALISEIRYWLNAFGGLTTITILAVSTYFVFQNREIANTYLMTPLRQSSLFIPDYSPIAMEPLVPDSPVARKLPPVVEPETPHPAVNYIRYAQEMFVAAFRACSDKFQDLPFPPPVDSGANAYRAWPMGLNFGEKNIVRILSVRSKLLTEAHRNKITQVWVGNMYAETVLLHVLPACLYNSAAMRIVLNVTLDLLVPVFLLLQGIFHVIPWLRENMNWFSVLVQADVGLRVVKATLAWLDWAFRFLTQAFFPTALFDTLFRIFTPVVQFANQLQGLLHSMLDVVGDYVFKVTSFVNYAQTNLWSHVKLFVFLPLKTVAAPFGAVLRPVFRWWSTIHIPKPPSLVSTLHHIWDRLSSLYNKTVLFIVHSWLPSKMMALWHGTLRRQPVPLLEAATSPTVAATAAAAVPENFRTPPATPTHHAIARSPTAASSRSSSCDTPSNRHSSSSVPASFSAGCTSSLSQAIPSPIIGGVPLSAYRRKKGELRRTRSASFADLEHFSLRGLQPP